MNEPMNQVRNQERYDTSYRGFSSPDLRHGEMGYNRIAPLQSRQRYEYFHAEANKYLIMLMTTELRLICQWFQSLPPFFPFTRIAQETLRGMTYLSSWLEASL